MLDEVLKPVGLVKGDHGIFDCDRALFSELAQGAGHGLSCRACHGSHLFMRKQQREAIAAVDMLADLVGEFEEKTPEATGNRFSESDAACVLKREAVLLADALNGAHLRFAMVAEECEKSLALNGAKLRWGERFG